MVLNLTSLILDCVSACDGYLPKISIAYVPAWYDDLQQDVRDAERPWSPSQPGTGGKSKSISWMLVIVLVVAMAVTIFILSVILRK